MSEEGSGSSRRKSILSNGSWGVAQQLAVTGGNAIFSILVVVVLSVEDYGAYSYATAMFALGHAIMTAGLSGLAVKALVHATGRQAHVLGALMLIRECFALGAYVCLVSIALTSGSATVILTVIIVAAALFGRAADAPELWYQAEQRMAVPARIRIVAAIFMFALRIMALMWWPDLWVFAVLFFIEHALAGSAIIVRYWFDSKSPRFGKPDGEHARGLLKDSLPLFLSGVANQINLRSDVIILQALLGATAVGIYSAAARLSELTHMIPIVILNAAFPIILGMRRKTGKDSLEYRELLQRSYNYAFWGGVGIAAVLGVAGTFIISVVFGDEYGAALPVLYVHLISVPFIFMAAVYSKWIIAENLLWASLIRHGAGAVLNVLLNFALIPIIGLMGSAIATVVSYIFASYLACFIGVRTRVAGVQMNLAIVAPIRYIIRRSRRE
ncbi:MAG: flippase [Microbacterium gubbeenense]|uniref:flippase n=1 Tax=Microbacterium gubbeenense TaxID=159896 RepID=UPI003F9D7328